MLLGASLSATAVLALGTALLIGIAATVVVAMCTSYTICRALRLPKRLSVLVACGNSICGNSAIAAVAPAIGATNSEIASSIAFTAVLGVFVVLTLPLLVPILRLSLSQYGVLAGLTVYAVPQALAATLPIGALSNQIGTIVKLVRVLMLGPVVFGLSLVAARLRPAGAASGERGTKYKAGLREFVPWFIAGFLIVAVALVHRLNPRCRGQAGCHGCRNPDDDFHGRSGPWRRRPRRGSSGPARDHRGDPVARRADDHKPVPDRCHRRTIGGKTGIDRDPVAPPIAPTLFTPSRDYNVASSFPFSVKVPHHNPRNRTDRRQAGHGKLLRAGVKSAGPLFKRANRRQRMTLQRSHENPERHRLFV